jgi:hypothetical protein
MDTLRVDICYRPLRLGWAIRHGDFDALREVFRSSHTLWGGRYNPIVVVDNDDAAKQIIEGFRVDVIWPVGNTEAVTRFPDRCRHLINPFLEKSLVVGRGEEDRRAQLLDVHSALISMNSDDRLRAIRDKGFRIYSWQADDPLADLFLIQLGAYPDPAEFGIDYKEILTSAVEPEELTLPRDRPLLGDIVERPSIPYLPRDRMRRHYTTPAGWDYPGFYVGDVTNFDDLVAFWNLRASDIPLWFVDPNHIARYADLIPAWEKEILPIVARRPEHLNRTAIWARADDPAPIMPLFEGRHRTFCRVHDNTWRGGAVTPPMMFIGEAQTLGTVSRSGDKPCVSFALANKEFPSDRWFHTQHLVASLSFGIGLHGDDTFTLEPPYVPELNEFLARNMQFDYSKLRVEPERLGVIIDASDTDSSISGVSVSELFEQVFRQAE